MKTIIGTMTAITLVVIGNLQVQAQQQEQVEPIPGLVATPRPTNLTDGITRHETLDRFGTPYVVFLARNGGALCQSAQTAAQLEPKIKALLHPGEVLKVHPQHHYFYVLLGTVSGTSSPEVQTTRQTAQASTSGISVTPVVQTHPTLGPITVFRVNGGKLNATEAHRTEVTAIAAGKTVLSIPKGVIGEGSLYVK